MKKILYGVGRGATYLLASLALGGMFALSATADTYRMTPNSGGGVPAASVITSYTQTSSNATLGWYGLQGWYGIQAATSPGGPWTTISSVKATDFAWTKTVNNPDPTNAYFFQLSQANSFAGSSECSSCHGDKYSEWRLTGHATAINAILTTNGTFLPFRDASCLPCHTVGNNQPTGYAYNAINGSANHSSYLANVGCENCHGPAGWHKNSDHSAIRPVVSLDPAICGSCHQDSHHPTYDEYETTMHAEVNDDVKYGFANGVYYPNTIILGGTNVYGYYVTTNANLTLKTNVTTGIISSLNGAPYLASRGYDPGQDRAVGCGICHSAATRMAMLYDYEARKAGRTNYLNMPMAEDAGAWTATCATCHDPHVTNNVAQLRNPLFSTNYYTMPTTSDKRAVYFTNFNGSITTNVYWMSAAFASLYDPNIQVCGQCHNSRGARWDGRSYGLITVTNIGGPVTNMILVDISTTVTNIQVFTNSAGIPYLTNTYVHTYVSGKTNVSVVLASVTNKSVITGLTPTVSYSRPPHHSPQYNLVSGILQPDYLNSNGTNTIGVAANVFGVHSLMAEGCVTCHMAKKTVASPTDQDPNYTGHGFEPLLSGYTGCAVSGCHSSPSVASNKMASLQFEVSTGVTNLVTLLNLWATIKGPALFTTNYSKYLQNSWEYTAPGAFATITNAGPSASEQLMIPAGIRQARFNLYMVGYGNTASLGVHNPTYTRLLLNNANSKVLQALQ